MHLASAKTIRLSIDEIQSCGRSRKLTDIHSCTKLSITNRASQSMLENDQHATEAYCYLSCRCDCFCICFSTTKKQRRTIVISKKASIAILYFHLQCMPKALYTVAHFDRFRLLLKTPNREKTLQQGIQQQALSNTCKYMIHDDEQIWHSYSVDVLHSICCASR